MPTWTQTPESVEMYRAWRAISHEYDAMIDVTKIAATFNRQKIDDVINRMQAAYVTWLASMPRRDP